MSLDNSDYDFLSGKLTERAEGTRLPLQNFYLVIDNITMEDNNKQFACLNENDVDYKHEYFFGDHTTVVVHSDEGKANKVTTITN